MKSLKKWYNIYFKKKYKKILNQFYYYYCYYYYLAKIMSFFSLKDMTFLKIMDFSLQNYHMRNYKKKPIFFYLSNYD